MKIIKHVQPACRCQDRLVEFADAQDANAAPLYVGSIVECDCGKQYKLVEHQLDGLYWEWYHPDSGDMSKR